MNNKQYKNPALKYATEQVNKLIAFILSSSEKDEIWREIVWADSNYFVSSKGRVLSLCRNNPKLLKPFMCNDYLCVSICGHDRRINRLVAQAFIPNPENKAIAHHLNHIKTNNDISNLAWATHSENTLAYFDNKKNQQTKQVEGTEK